MIAGENVARFGRCRAAVVLFPAFVAVLFGPGSVRAEPPLTRQILVEANIWEINESANIDYGVIWDLEDLDAEINDLLDSSIYLPSGAGNTGAFIQTTLDIFREQTRDGVTDDYLVAQLDTTLQAAAGEGTVHLRANPKIVVAENEQAVIHAGERFPVTELTVSKQGLPTLNTVYKDTGVILTVIPTVFREDFVVLAVRPEVTDITSFVEEAAPPAVEGGDPQIFRLPVLADRSAFSRMIVRSGGTVIMSGLLQEIRRETRREVPILGKIPLLGWLFRSYDLARVKSDILFEITPTILEPGESGFTPNGLIFEGEVFQSDSDLVREIQESQPPPAAAEPGIRGRAEDWFGVPTEESPAEPSPVEPSPVEPSPVEPSPVEPSPAEPSPAEEAPDPAAAAPAPAEGESPNETP
jgi:hypothetical protein